MAPAHGRCSRCGWATATSINAHPRVDTITARRRCGRRHGSSCSAAWSSRCPMPCMVAWYGLGFVAHVVCVRRGLGGGDRHPVALDHQVHLFVFGFVAARRRVVSGSPAAHRRSCSAGRPERSHEHRAGRGSDLRAASFQQTNARGAASCSIGSPTISRSSCSSTMFFVIFCGYPVAFVLGGTGISFALIGWLLGVFELVQPQQHPAAHVGRRCGRPGARVDARCSSSWARCWSEAASPRTC